MNKRGDANQQMILLIAEIILGAILMLGVPMFVITSFSTSEEEVLSKDISLTIDTMMSAPSRVYYAYPNIGDEYTVTIKDDGNLIVSSLNGEFIERKYYGMENVKIQPATIKGKVSIGMNFDNDLLSFEKLKKSEEELCSLIEGSFDYNPDVSIKTFTLDPEYIPYLKNIKERITALYRVDGDDANFDIVNEYEFDDADVRIILSFNIPENNNLILTHYESIENKAYTKLSCYLKTQFSEGTDVFDGINENSDHTQEQIQILLGSPEEFKKEQAQNPQIFNTYAKLIYDGIKNGVKR